jgi:hypothetical protein
MASFTRSANADNNPNIISWPVPAGGSVHGVGSLLSSCSVVIEIGHIGHIGQKALKSLEYWLKSTVFLR